MICMKIMQNKKIIFHLAQIGGVWVVRVGFDSEQKGLQDEGVRPWLLSS